jgi:alkylhydroperoxidase family enzyme
VTDDQLAALPAYEQSSAFSEVERLVLDYAVAMTDTPVVVRDELYAKLAAHFERAQLVELTASIAWENYRARFDHALGIEAQGFSEGAFCALPDPAVPRLTSAREKA